jgi:hypothetical protein
MTGEVTGDAPAVRETYELLLKYWESNRQVPRVGERVEPWLRQTGLFGEVNIHEVVLPFGNPSSATTDVSESGAAQNTLATSRRGQEGRAAVVDPRAKVGALAKIITDSSRRGFSVENHHPGIVALGFTPELRGRCVEQFGASEWRMDMPLHFVSARKIV